MSCFVFALGFQQETQNGQLCTEPVSSRNRPESQGENWIFESQLVRPRYLRSTGWTSCPRRSGVKGTVATSGKRLCPAEWKLTACQFSYGIQVVSGKRERERKKGGSCIYSVVVNFVSQLPNCKTKEICGNSKCPAAFPHPSSGKDEPAPAGPCQSILRLFSKQRTGRESGLWRCESLPRGGRRELSLEQEGKMAEPPLSLRKELPGRLQTKKALCLQPSAGLVASD